MPAIPIGQERYLANGSNSNAAALTAGRWAPTMVNGRLCLNNDGNLPLVDVAGALSAEIGFFGPGSDNGSFNFRLWAADWAVAGGGRERGHLELWLMGTGTATLSTLQGITGGQVVLATERIADTLTWTKSSESSTPKGPMTKKETQYSEGTSDVYSPADNTPARLILPTLGRASALVMEVTSRTNVTTGNCWIAPARY